MAASLIIDVAFLPDLARDLSTRTCVVVDVLRASSTIVTLVARGAREVVVTDTLSEARRLAQGGDYLLCGEEGGLPPPGFDYGNSPGQFSRLDLAGQRLVLCTSNGTRALVRAAAAPLVLVGALLNATSVMAAALARGHGRDILIVCAGEDYGTSFCLEDAYTAGVLVEAALRCCRRAALPLPQLSDAAQAARRLHKSFQGRAKAALRVSAHGQHLRRLGLGADVAFCAHKDRYSVVPALEPGPGGILRVVPG